jgi:hypothetical protein
MDKKIEWYNGDNIAGPNAYAEAVYINNQVIYNVPGQPTNIFVTKHPTLKSPY